MSQSGPSIPGVEISRRLAVGGMAEVFLASQTLPDGGLRPVVVKRLLPGADETWRALFEREREVLAAVDSPRIVRLLGGGDDHLLLEYVDGPDLGALLAHHRKRGRPLPVGAGLAVIEGVAEGLADLHAAQAPGGGPLEAVHRDVNPSNVLVRRDGRITLIDLGVVRLGDRTTTAGIKGTLVYMAPEQLAGRPVDARADVYAAGLVAFETLTGVPARPPEGGGLAELLAVRSRLPAPPSSLRPGLPPALDAVILAALAPSPEDRPADGAALLAALRDAGLVGDAAALAAATQGVGGPAPRPSVQQTLVPETTPDQTSVDVESTTVAPAAARPTGRPLALLAAVLAVGAGLAWAAWPTAEPGQTTRVDGRVIGSLTAPWPGLADSLGALETDAVPGKVADTQVPAPEAGPTPPEADAPVPEPLADTAPAPPPVADPGRPLLRRRGVEVRATKGTVHVRGAASDGLAPRKTAALEVGEVALLELTGGTTKPFGLKVRVKRKDKDTMRATIGAAGAQWLEVRCGSGDYKPMPRTTTFSRSQRCEARHPGTGSSLGFQLRVVTR